MSIPHHGRSPKNHRNADDILLVHLVRFDSVENGGFDIGCRGIGKLEPVDGAGIDLGLGRTPSDVGSPDHVPSSIAKASARAFFPSMRLRQER